MKNLSLSMLRFQDVARPRSSEIGPVCFWEDDGRDEQDADAVWGGPNRSLSLRQAQGNFKLLGAGDPRHVINVRKPEPDEI